MRQKHVTVILVPASVEVQRVVAIYRRVNIVTRRIVNANAALLLLPAYRGKHVIVLQITTMVSASAVLQILAGENQVDNTVTQRVANVNVVQQ